MPLSSTPSELRYRLLFEAARDAIFVVDGKIGRILDANKRALELTGHSLDELRELPTGALHPASYLGRVKELFASDSVSGEGREVVLPIEHRDGRHIVCEFTTQWVRHNGEYLLFSIVRDLTDRIAQNERIRLHLAAMQSVSVGLTISDATQPDMPLIYVNPAFEEITGYTSEEILGQNCRFLQGKERRQSDLPRLRAALRDGRPCNVRLRNYRKDGTLFWNDLHVSPVRDEAGKLTHFIGIQRDVTDSVESRRALAESETRYRLLAENASDLILRTSLDGTLLFVSPTCARMLGYAPAQVQGRLITDFVHPEDRAALRDQILRKCRDCNELRSTVRWIRACGSVLWIETSARLVSARDDTLDELVLVARDVTVRRLAEEEMKRALSREREASELKSRFVSMVSHEFRTPLTGISASASFLNDYAEKASPEQRQRHFRNIAQSVSRMTALLEDVLLFSRAEAGHLTCKPAPLDLSSLATEMVEQSGAEAAGVELTLDLAKCVQRPLLLDEALLRHIFQNLLSNAVKYSGAARKVLFRVVCRGAKLVATVQDWGLGIPPEEQDTVFEPFSRASNTGTISGTGLGLSIVRKAVELHGGVISFVSVPGQGTTFTVELPVSDAPPSKKTKPKAHETHSQSPFCQESQPCAGQAVKGTKGGRRR